jgi:xanthine dehydrogenase accessory factor
MNVDEVRGSIERWRAAGRCYAEAVVTATWHSAPRRAGARFVRSEEGEIAGNVSAGCVEADLAVRLDAVLAGSPPTLVTYGVSDEAAHGVGLACGGTIEVWLAARGPDDRVWSSLVDRLDARVAGMLLTDTSPEGAAARWLLDPNGRVISRDGRAPERPSEAAVDAGRGLLATGGVAIVEEASGARTLVEVFLPARRIVVVGATPIGAALEGLARAAGISASVVEPRTAYAAGLPGEAQHDGRWPVEALADLRPDRSTAVAVVAHDARIDEEALTAALASEAGYIGLLGGKKTREARFAALRATGLDTQDVERVRAPIGLDIGAETPGEVALAILAEIVATWRGGP